MVRMVSNTGKPKTQREAVDVRPGYYSRFPARHSMLLRCDLYNKAGVGERQGVRPALGEARRGRQLMDKQQLFGSKQRGSSEVDVVFPSQNTTGRRKETEESGEEQGETSLRRPLQRCFARLQRRRNTFHASTLALFSLCVPPSR